jgi:hypothetical protein
MQLEYRSKSSYDKWCWLHGDGVGNECWLLCYQCECYSVPKIYYHNLKIK